MIYAFLPYSKADTTFFLESPKAIPFGVKLHFNSLKL